ncbi:MAG: amidohydrolase [Defluviitaleaceae bacterium]|nr:amidohydrolase [Defluviitaleaceae bacterium]
MTKIAASAQNLQPQLVNWRRDFHKHPELGWTEFRTASIVAKNLADFGYQLLIGGDAMDDSQMLNLLADDVLQVQTKRAITQGAFMEYIDKMQGGKTAVMGILDTGKPGPVIALRVDMDALPIKEADEVAHFPHQQSFASINEGVMHACGHDGHTAIGLGIAKMLADSKGQLKGIVKIIFQPAEEGVQGGATSIIKKGLVDDVSHMLGFHIGLAAKSGEVYCQTTDFLAATKFNAHFTGKTAHAGANPEDGKSALLAAATATMGLQGIYRHSGGASRISVGVLQSGTSSNIVPDKAFMALETRGETTQINNFMKGEAARIIEAAARMHDVSHRLEIVGEASAATCDQVLVNLTKKTAQDLSIFNHVGDSIGLHASEDYSFFMEHVQARGGKATHLIMGADLADAHHTKGFDFDEDCLWKTAALFTAMILEISNQ